jgi:hypothetical protein
MSLLQDGLLENRVWVKISSQEALEESMLGSELVGRKKGRQKWAEGIAKQQCILNTGLSSAMGA